MRRITSAVFVVMIAAARAGAQTTDHPFNELARYLDADDTVHVVTHAFGEVSGRVATVSGNALTITGGTDPLRVPSSEIAWIDKRGDAVWNGALVGAGITAVLFAGAAGASCEDCPSEMTTASLVGAGIGGGFGAIIDWLHHGRTLLYGTRPPSVHGLHAEPPVGLIGQLWSRIRPGDSVSVRRFSGDTLSGRFVRASDAALVIDSGGRQLQIEAREIEAVDRHGSHLARGLLFGSAAGATLTATSALSSGASGGETVFAAAIGGISGIAWGALIGRIVPRHIPAYVAPPRAVRLAPILKPGQRGALFSVRY